MILTFVINNLSASNEVNDLDLFTLVFKDKRLDWSTRCNVLDLIIELAIVLQKVKNTIQVKSRALSCVPKSRLSLTMAPKGASCLGLSPLWYTSNWQYACCLYFYIFSDKKVGKGKKNVGETNTPEKGEVEMSESVNPLIDIEEGKNTVVPSPAKKGGHGAQEEQ